MKLSAAIPLALLACAASSLASISPQPDYQKLFSERDQEGPAQFLQRRQQGIGGAGQNGPGYQTVPNVPFLGSDSLPYSPPFYPTPSTQGTSQKWKDAIGKARAYLQQFNQTEKVILTTGSGWQRGPCVGNISPIPRVGFPGLCLMDGPAGVRGIDRVTSFPDAITAAATFDRDLFYKRAYAMGQEFKTKGANIWLGPMMNLARSPEGGRSWEGFGADPYLSGEGSHYSVLGAQDAGVQANLKHYILNEQEHFRNEGSSNIDSRTERELYQHPFLRGIQAGAASVMCSYNLVNNSWACQNSELLNNRLKTEMHFPGYVMSDWGAQHAGVASANAGLDMTMPGDVLCCSLQEGSLWGGNLTSAVNNGSVATTRLNDMATRILAGWFLLGQDQGYPKPNFNFFDKKDPATNQFVDATADHYKVAREVAKAGTVLLKNHRNALPIKKPRTMAVVGSDAGPLYQGANYWPDRAQNGGLPYGTLGQGWGSGSTDYSYFFSPYEAIQARAREDRTDMQWNFDDFNLKQSVKIANMTDVALVFVSAGSGEGYITVDRNEGDRNNLTLWNQGEQLIRNVTAVNNNTVVIIHSVGAVDMESFAENPNVTAIVWANLPGSESGRALVDVLYGDFNPSGRLPYTIGKKRTDYSADVLYYNDTVTPQVNYTEALNIDYRHFDSKNIEPRYEFGFGLSYTKFDYSGASTQRVGWADNSWWGSSNASSGLPDWLFQPKYEVTFSLTNSGNWDGHEVWQAYLEFPRSAGEPPKVLRGFGREYVEKYQTKEVKFHLSQYDASTWCNEKNQWLQPDGKLKVVIGASSRDIRQAVVLN
ncbi:probable beta-glucosidase [Ustilago bromivora]|uniref:beta-glucosidase n=1 Tax=Ustilago bromivora TaxID=307758 RepID=A0A1K0FX22_9BASI|nr:probable beta-glucosidase [Ustilago bromivora]SYW77072.1 probable beta-glucosidase [Ustilago bromivora]